MSNSLGLLPQPKARWRPFVTSWVTQVLALAIVLNVDLLYPPQLMRVPTRFLLTHLIAAPPPVPQEPQPFNPRLLAKWIPPVAPLIEGDTPRLLLPKMPQQEETVRAPKLERKAELLPQLARAAAPKVMATNTFSTGTSLVATTSRPADRVQTGGFGDPFGVPARGSPNRASNINAVGSWGLPSGAGKGAGSGGEQGVPGVPISAGFGRGVAAPGAGGGGMRGEIRQAGFGGARALPQEPKPKLPEAPNITPVEILSKPSPVYTDEGRRLKIEGVVRLEVVFTAAGKVQVARVIQGLGHGLDEAAVRAAEQIRFKPAQRAGETMDSPAILQIIFQLA